MKVAEAVYEKISPMFTGDIKLVDVEYVKRNDGMHLVILIDKDDGIRVEDCVYVNSLVDEVIEELNPTNDAKYYLDVSSYGLDRPLKFDWQFKKYYDKKVNVKLYRKIDDKKEFVGILKSKDDKCIIVNVDDFDLAYDLVDVAYVSPYIKF